MDDDNTLPDYICATPNSFGIKFIFEKFSILFKFLLPGMHKCHNLPRYKEDSKVRSPYVEDDTAVASLKYQNKY